MLIHRDNYYETAVNCLDSARASFAKTKGNKDPGYLLARGLQLMAQGLLQESRIVEGRLAEIEELIRTRQ